MDAAHYNASSNSTCAPGLVGTYCQRCRETTTHYLERTGSHCTPCNTARVAAICSVAAMAAALFGLRVCWQRLLATHQHLVAFAVRVSFRAKLRTTVSFYQIVTQCAAAHSNGGPFQPELSDFPNPLPLRTHHRSNSSHGTGPEDVLLSPILESRLAGWAMSTACASPSRTHGCSRLSPSPISTSSTGSVHFRALAPAVPFVLNWTLLLFPSISSRGFRALAPCDCFPYADGSEVCFLREDYGVECSGPSVGDAPPSVRAPAWVAIIFWAAGVPLLYACLLSTPHLRGSLSTLTGDYRPEAAWWELVHVGEKLILVGFLSLFEPGQWSQIFVAALVALSALLLKMWVWPYRSATGDQPRELDTH
jgi:hypothetical protein